MAARTGAGKSGYSMGRIWFPLSPGPPGLTTRVPSDADPPVATIRLTAIRRVPADGFA
jgi:hypothetical protein